VPAQPFTHAVTAGWIRSVAAEPSPDKPWPDTRWDEQLLQDQIRFLDVQAELGVKYNRPWGVFIGRRWPVPFQNVVSAEREKLIIAFMTAAHERGIKILAGTGIYSWGFEEVIEKCPEVIGAGQNNRMSMCAFSDAAWDWQRRVLDFQMDPKWAFDGVSMQSADQGRCQCEKCKKLSNVEHHAELLIRSADYMRRQRPDWTIGQASWGLRVDDPGSLCHVQRIAEAVDYIIEVQERSARGDSPWRKELIASLGCAFGSVGGVFVGHPQHWQRLRWFLPCGLRSAQALKKLHDEGGRACEYHYRVFTNPTEEVSWRTGARILVKPETPPQQALRDALTAVYGASGAAVDQLADIFTRAEDAYFTRSNFTVGDGELSLEPLIWDKNPAAAGPPIYLRDRMTPEARGAYAKELKTIKADLADLDVPNQQAKRSTLTGLNGTLADIAALA